VEIDAEEDGVEDRDPLADEAGQDPGEHVARAGGCQRGRGEREDFEVVTPESA
jgi:hypothetical protein